MELKELREKREPIVQRMRELADLSNDEKREWTTEDKINWEAVNGDLNNLNRDIGRLERCKAASAAEAALVAPAGNQEVGQQAMDPEVSERAAGERTKRTEPVTAETEDLALRGGFMQLRGERPDEHQQRAMEAAGIHVNCDKHGPGLVIPIANTRQINTLRREGRALSTDSVATGGGTIAEGFVPQFEGALLAFGGMREIADITRTAEGNDLPWPTEDDTGNTGELIAEGTSVSDADPTLATVVFHAYKYSSKRVKISWEMLNDSAFDLASWLSGKLATRLGRIFNTHATTGTGAAQPFGITLASTLGVTTAASDAITTDEILDLIHSVDPSYRSNPGTAFMFHDSVTLFLRKLKDGEGRYIWQEGTQGGQPSTLFAYRVVTNQDMASTLATTAISMEFGDFGKYKIREVSNIRLIRDPWTDVATDQEGFFAFMRFDSNLLDAGTNPIKHMLQV